MDTFQYPDWFSTLDREQIDQAVLAANRTGTFAYHGPSECFVGQGPFAVSDVAAVQFAVDVFAVVVQILQRRRARQLPDTLRWAAEDLLDQIIVWAQRKQPAQTLSVILFADTVKKAVHAAPWWIAFQQLCRPAPSPDPLTEPVTDQPVRRAPLVPLADAARILTCSPDTLLRHCKAGTVTLQKIGKLWKMSQAELDRLLDSDKYLK